MFPFRELIGALLWIALLTRPDIANAVRAAARYCSAPKLIHWKAARSILGYAVRTSSFGISFQKGVDGAWFDFVRRCRLCFAQYGQEERVGGSSDVQGGLFRGTPRRRGV